MACSPGSSHDSFLIQAATSKSPAQLSTATDNLLCKRGLYSKGVIDDCLLRTSGNGSSVLLQALLVAGANLECRDDKGNTPLMVAVINNQISTARLLLSQGANVNAVNNAGDTALILSTYFGSSYSATELLLEIAGVNVQHRNLNGFTALECATQEMNLEAMYLLIDADADCLLPSCDNFVDYNSISVVQNNLLNCAIKNGTLDVIRYFKLQKDQGKKALTLAAERSDIRSIHYILSIDNSVLNYNSSDYLISLISFLRSIKQLFISDKEYNTFYMLTHNYMQHRKPPSNKLLENQAFRLAVKIGHTSIIHALCLNRFFISNEVVGEVAAIGNRFLLEMLISHGGTVCKVDHTGRCLYPGSALDRAIQSEHFDCADLLLNSGAIIDISMALKFCVDCNSEKSLEYLCGKFPRETNHELTSSKILHVAVYRGQVNIINTLLEKGASVNLVHDENAPLMSAVDLDIVAFLVSKGANVNMVIGSNVTSKSILHHFVSAKYKQYLKTKFTLMGGSSINILQAALVKELIHHGARVSCLDSLARTPLMVAAETDDSSEVIEVLLEAGADVDERSHNGESALHRAVRCGLESNVKCLLESGADINVRSANGQSVLFMCDNDDLLNVLIENDADVNAEDFEGNTALIHHILNWDVDEDIIDSLITAESDVNHANKSGRTPLLLAAKMLKPDILSALVRSGADVNYSIIIDYREMSPVTFLMKRLRRNRLHVRDCLTSLLNHGLTAETVPPCIIHTLISVSLFSLVAKFIALGIPPTLIEIHRHVNAWIKTKYTISPLDAAILINNCELAQFFVNIRYLTSKDVQTFSNNTEIKTHLLGEGHYDTLNFVKKYSSQPLSLETLCFIAVSEAIGDGPERAEAIESCGLPLPLEEALLFKKVSSNMEDTSMSNRFLLKSSLQQAQLSFMPDEFVDINSEYSSEYDTVSDRD